MQYLTACLEDYLEIIHILHQSMPSVGITDVAKVMGISKPGVTKAIKTLKNNNLVIQEKYGKIILTPEGENVAEAVYSKHKMLRRFLIEALNVSSQTAEIDACKIEHVVSRETLDGVRDYLKKHEIEG